MIILHETSHYIAVNKPAGLVVEQNPWERSAEDWVQKHLEKTKIKPFIGVVHRLDRVTSGVLIFAKKKSALKHLNKQFEMRTVRKTYLAVVQNKPTPSTKHLTHWLLKDQKEKCAIIYQKKTAKAQKVQLQYRLLEQKGDNYVLEVKPLTGKFHQIRAQLAAIGCPIIGDVKYGGKKQGDGLAIGLYAHQLTFLDPKTEQKVTITSNT